MRFAPYGAFRKECTISRAAGDGQICFGPPSNGSFPRPRPPKQTIRNRPSSAEIPPVPKAPRDALQSEIWLSRRQP